MNSRKLAGNRLGTVSIGSALFLLLVACSGNKNSTEEEIAASLSLINELQLVSHVNALADDAMAGREAGEIGYDDAAAYVVAEFEKMGVTPGANGSWYQSVPLRGYKISEGSPTVTIHTNWGDDELVYRDDFSMSADAVREATSVTAEVVYAGHGVHAPELGYSDYDGIDVNGKIIAVFRGAPESLDGNEGAYYSSSRTKSLEAVARGAVGSISLRSEKSEERSAWDKFKDRIGKRERKTWVSDDGRAAGHYPELQAGASLNLEVSKRLFEGAGMSYDEAQAAMLESNAQSFDLGVSVTIASQFEHSTVSSANVIGVVEGTNPDLRDEYIVYTAHLDHVGVREESGAEEDDGNDEKKEKDLIRNGMYDNAMGVALMLETARAIAAAPLQRSVMFVALTAEEAGLLGSDFFVNNPSVPVESIVANINLDMPLFLYPVADLVAFGSQHSSLQAVVESSSHAEGFSFSEDPMPEERLFVRSDQYSFVRAGIPAVYLVTGFNSTDPEINGEELFKDHLENHYHDVSDDLTRPVDWDSAVRFARAHTRIGQAIANTHDRPTWNEGDFFGDKFAAK